MNVNGVTGIGEDYSYAKAEVAVSGAKKSPEDTSTNPRDLGVVYEPTLKTPTKVYKANEQLIAKLKADAQSHIDQLQQIVTQLINKQGDAYSVANDIWSALRTGNFTVDAETKAQAQADIAEDGYWGVNQTSDRIIDFATALTGGDSSKIETMRAAFQKGYEQAEKTWGGKLPDISQKTFDAVMKKFDDLAASATTTITEQ